MPKGSLTTTAQVEVKLETRAQQMLKQRFEEYAKLDNEIGEREARQDRIKAEVLALFEKDGQSAALEAGTSIDGYKVKLVKGTNKILMKDELMRTFGIDAEELNAFYDEKPKKAYVKITAPGKRDREDDNA